MSDLVGSVTDMADYAGATPSAEAWFAGGERVGYDPKARAIDLRHSEIGDDQCKRLAALFRR
jgi:hypothetical protein